MENGADLAVERAAEATEASVGVSANATKEQWLDTFEHIICERCASGADEDNLLVCDGCGAAGARHTYCARPELKSVPEGDWFCERCVLQRRQLEHSPELGEGLLKSEHALAELSEPSHGVCELWRYKVPLARTGCQLLLHMRELLESFDRARLRPLVEAGQQAQRAQLRAQRAALKEQAKEASRANREARRARKAEARARLRNSQGVEKQVKKCVEALLKRVEIEVKRADFYAKRAEQRRGHEERALLKEQARLERARQLEQDKAEREAMLEKAKAERARLIERAKAERARNLEERSRLLSEKREASAAAREAAKELRNEAEVSRCLERVLMRVEKQVLKEAAAAARQEARAAQLACADTPECELFCVCRKPYNPNLFWVGCDICEGWFHGRCVGVRSEIAQLIDEYVCPSCEQKTGEGIKWKVEKAHLVPEDFVNGIALPTGGVAGGGAGGGIDVSWRKKLFKPLKPAKPKVPRVKLKLR